MLQVNADWFIFGTAEKLEKELLNFVFRGPGFYLTEKDTLLITIDRDDTTWKKNQPDSTIYVAYVWNCAFEDTIFSVITSIPNRQDER